LLFFELIDAGTQNIPSLPISSLVQIHKKHTKKPLPQERKKEEEAKDRRIRKKDHKK